MTVRADRGEHHPAPVHAEPRGEPVGGESLVELAGGFHASPARRRKCGAAYRCVRFGQIASIASPTTSETNPPLLGIGRNKGFVVNVQEVGELLGRHGFASVVKFAASVATQAHSTDSRALLMCSAFCSSIATTSFGTNCVNAWRIWLRCRRAISYFHRVPAASPSGGGDEHRDHHRQPEGVPRE